jgi:hypothetical protein
MISTLPDPNDASNEALDAEQKRQLLLAAIALERMEENCIAMRLFNQGMECITRSCEIHILIQSIPSVCVNAFGLLSAFCGVEDFAIQEIRFLNQAKLLVQEARIASEFDWNQSVKNTTLIKHAIYTAREQIRHSTINDALLTLVRCQSELIAQQNSSKQHKFTRDKLAHDDLDFETGCDIELHNSHRQLLHMIATFLLLQGQFEASQIIIKQIINISERINDDWMQLQSQLELALCCIMCDRAKQALEVLKQCNLLHQTINQSTNNNDFQIKLCAS